MNEYDERHQEYRRQLQNIVELLKKGDTNIQSELHDLEWSVKNDLNRISIIGKDAFEDEVEDVVKFLPVIDAIKKKYNFNYQIDEMSFDDYEDDNEDEELYEDEELMSLFTEFEEDESFELEDEDQADDK